MTWGWWRMRNLVRFQRWLGIKGAGFWLKWLTKSLDKSGLLENMPNERASSSSGELDYSSLNKRIFVSLSSYSSFLWTIWVHLVTVVFIKNQPKHVLKFGSRQCFLNGSSHQIFNDDDFFGEGKKSKAKINSLETQFLSPECSQWRRFLDAGLKKAVPYEQISWFTIRMSLVMTLGVNFPSCPYSSRHESHTCVICEVISLKFLSSPPALASKASSKEKEMAVFGLSDV